MNPYDFVRIDWSQGVDRRPPIAHDRFSEGLSGRIEGTITTLTPFFIPQTEDLKRKESLYRSNRPITFGRNGLGQAVIPGSSLKGLFRSLVETIGPGCWWLYDGEYRDHINFTNRLPRQFKKCPQRSSDTERDGLCIACRLFGLIKGSELLLGKVGFEDAVCSEPVPHNPIYTPVLDAPKPRHRAWYLDTSATQVAGRKFFFHSEIIRTERELKQSRQDRVLNQYIQPIGAESLFTFSAHFTNVEPDEWPVLLYALTLERTDWGHEHDVRPKMGYAKPAGLGSIDVQLAKLTLINYRERYTAPSRGCTAYEGDALRNYVNDQVRERFLNANSVTLQDLRRIWQWPPAAEVTYRYPSQSWFSTNPNTPIAGTP